MARKKKDPTPALPELDAIRHKETRKNIPTEELRDFVAADEANPPKMLYPRDPSLDPQLVWKGKDEQDREPLEVDVVPIYIQEVIEPRVIIDAVEARKTTKPDNGGFLPGFFDDFEAMEFDHKVEFYQHDQHWANRMILGNSLQVMTSLAEKEGLKGKVQMIYIDPPYGIKYRVELAGLDAEARREGWEVRRHNTAARADSGVPRHLEDWDSLLSCLSSRSVDRCEGLADRDRKRLRPDRRSRMFILLRSFLDEIFGSQNFVSLDHRSRRRRRPAASGAKSYGLCSLVCQRHRAT